MKNFLASEWHRQAAVKRGGAVATVSIDSEDAETRYQFEPAHALTPEAIYDRRWTPALLERAVDDVRQRYAGRGQTEVFDALKGHLGSDPGGLPYQELSQQLGQSEPAVALAGRVGPLDDRGQRKRPGSDRLVGRPKRRTRQGSGPARRGVRPPSASRAPRPLSGARR